jgi:YD repeat-containing protein
MSQVQICANGHRWDPTRDERPSVEERWNRCPVCGGAAELFSLRDTNASGNGSAPDTPRAGLTPGAPPPPVPGYDVLDEIGRGGMGVIYKARQQGAGRIVALKMLSAGAHAGPSELKRFRTEVDAVSRLRHPHIVEVYEIGEAHVPPFLALEYMDRGSLADALAGSPLPPRYAAELIELLARAVQALHEQDIVHRDLKPHNVLLATPPANGEALPLVVRLLGVPKVTDFGLARRMDADGVQTRTGAVLGTPNYMAPEQAEGKSREVGPGVDVYALGAILYECLTGRPPFRGATPMETLDQVRRQDPVPPTRVVAEVPRDLETICLKARARDPAARYRSAAALASDLRNFLGGSAITAKAPGTLRRGWKWVRRHAAMVGVVAAAVVVAAAGIGIGALLRNGKEPDRPVGETEVATVEHFSSFVKRWGVPEGVYPLTEAQVRRRELSYRITSRDGKVERVEAIDRHGKLNNRHSQAPYLEEALVAGAAQRPGFSPLRVGRWAARAECRWEYHRNDKGDLSREVAYDRTGRVAWEFHYTTKTTGYFTDERGFPRPRAGSGAAYVAFVFSDEGLAREVQYLGRNGQRRPDRNGIFGRRIEHDTVGFEVSVEFLGSRRQPVQHPDGYAKLTRAYDRQGNLTDRAYFRLDGKPAFRRSPARPPAREAMKYDHDGNLIEWRADGEEAQARQESGPGLPALIRLEYDSQGFLVRRSFFDAKGKPWSFAAAMTYRNDNRGRVIEQRYVPSEDTAAARAALPGAQRMTYDDDGNLTERWTVGGQPARTKMRYDARGNVVEESYFDDANKAVVVAGAHKVTTAYNERGRMTERAFFGPVGKPARELRLLVRPGVRGVPPTPSGPQEEVPGPARWAWRWDEQGNLEEIACFGPDGKPFDLPVGTGPGRHTPPGFPSLPGGVARANLRHDDRGNVTELGFSDSKGQSAEAQGEVRAAKIKLAYDERGNRTEVSHLDAEGRLVRLVSTSRVLFLPRTTATFDDDGRMVSWAGFDADNKPAVGYQGAARLEWSFNDQGRLTSVAFQGGDEKPVLSQLGYARAVYSYDEQGRLTQSRYLDLEGHAVRTRLLVRNAPPQGELRPGDVVVRYAGQAVNCAQKLRALALAESGSGKQTEVVVLRGEERLTLKIWPPGGGGPFGPGRPPPFGGLLPRGDQLPVFAGIETVAEDE